MAFDFLSRIRTKLENIFGTPKVKAQPLRVESPIPQEDIIRGRRESFERAGGISPVGGQPQARPAQQQIPAQTPAQTVPGPIPTPAGVAGAVAPFQAQTFPAATPIPGAPINPFAAMIPQYFQGVDPQVISNIMFGESSFRPDVINVNRPGGGFHTRVGSQQELEALRQQYPSLDLGLMQINTAPAMENYLQNQGLSFYDLLDPATNLRVGSDLLFGRIPQTASGLQNWMAAISQGLVDRP